MPTHSGSDSLFAQAAHSSSNLHVGLLCVLLKKETHMHACINTHTHASNSSHLAEQFKSSSSKAQQILSLREVSRDACLFISTNRYSPQVPALQSQRNWCFLLIRVTDGKYSCLWIHHFYVMEIPFWALCWNVFTRLLSFASHLYLSVLNLYWTFGFFFFSSSHAHNAWLPYLCTANLLTSCSVKLQLSASFKRTHPLCMALASSASCCSFGRSHLYSNRSWGRLTWEQVLIVRNTGVFCLLSSNNPPEASLRGCCWLIVSYSISW